MKAKFLFLPLLIMTFPAEGQEYSLFNPVPEDKMREMSTDRPDTTESPYTVDAGHVQIELSFFEYAYNKRSDGKSQDYAILPSNIKLGLTQSMDLQLVFTPHERVKETQERQSASVKGFSGDAQVRLKINMWGNDEGDTALALMPYIKIPTNKSTELSNDKVEGGLIAPYAMNLPDDVTLGLMGQVDLVFNEEEDSYETDFLHTATLGRPLIGNLSGYVEYVGLLPADLGGAYQSLASAGITYEMNKNWILDAGIRVGLTESADDLILFTGTSMRF